MRALIAVRLSNVTDNTTSPTRQRKKSQGWCDGNGARVVGEALDLDVSASKVAPFKRPELGKWLAKPDEYDAIVFWRLDRAVRSMADMATLGQWAKTHGKLLVFAEGPGGAPLVLDMRATSLVSELIIMLLAFAAQMEAEAIKERVQGSRAELRSQGRWHGGRIPYGWTVIENPNGKGWVLVECPETGPIVREIIRRVIDGDSIYSIANDLDRREVPTATDLETKRKTGALPETLKKWDHQQISQMLRSEHLRGYTLHDPKATAKRERRAEGADFEAWEGRPLLDSDGHPRIDRPPLINDDDWYKLQEVMKTKERPEARINSAGSRLVRVAYCGGINKDGTACDEPMYGGSKKRLKNRKWTGEHVRIYRCKIRGTGHSVTVDADIVDQWAEDEFLKRIGNWSVMMQLADRGEDHSAEIARVNESIARLRRDREAGLYDEDDEAEYGSMIGKLLKERKKVKALPSRPASIVSVPTGKTYADLWHEADEEGKRRMMMRAGARLVVSTGKSIGPRFNYDRLSFAIGEHDDPEAAELEALVQAA
ncbi:recombinase family protein [Kitasatospora sp. NPDC088346]|uniref:recombinase family protein n=1 Tax=Kitasatospora sp. NPDC088346 TaxID=3364073 RepID=UPI003824513F